MRKLALIALIAITASLSGCGGPESVTSTESALGILPRGTQQYNGSYRCGPDWWHVEQMVRTSSDASGYYVTLPNDVGPTYDDPAANAVTIQCWYAPSLMAWSGSSEYNTAPLGGPDVLCVMYSHRPHQPWSYSAYVQLSRGAMQLYPGSPNTWLMSVADASTTGTHDGLAACGGSFYLSLQ